MRPRKTLSDKLHALCQNVYFQPPTGYKLKYPCIVYEFTGVEKIHADNLGYILCGKYSMTYITRDPDDDVKIQLVELPMCSMGQTFENDNLYHYSYTIYH